MTENQANGISIIVPTLNEEGNIHELIERIDRAMQQAHVLYEVIIVDDHSRDQTRAVALEMAQSFPVRFYEKQGQPGKAYSLLEGFRFAKYEFIAMIDADLQYPPESIPAMLQQLWVADVVVANRIDQYAPLIRRFVSKAFSLIFGRVLHGLTCDVQSGLKVFRRQIIREVKLNPSPWTFDLEFLLSARNAGYRIASFDMPFHERRSGESKVDLVRTSFEIGWNALKIRFKRFHPVRIQPSGQAMLGAGMAHRQKRFIVHSTLPHQSSAIGTFSPRQHLTNAGAAGIVFLGFSWAPWTTAIMLTATLSLIYFLDALFQLWLITRSLNQPPELRFTDQELQALNDNELPTYSILCPLYHEASVVSNFLKAVDRLDWPKDKLEVMLLLEEDDQETITAIQHLALPSFVRPVIVPDSFPRTKPKACNYGLSIATGEYVVVYDAEDSPEPSQLKKAFLGFRYSPPEIACLQAKLNFFNPNQNLLTRLFTAEYSLWFDVILPGLQSANTIIPLGGTSNHFRRRDLVALHGWDPFNVTEDCDLGVRLFMHGFRTEMIDSTTYEEANSNVRNWLRQRSRWIKGYMQTYLVHMRHPGAFFKRHRAHALAFQFNIGGKVLFLLINPLLWIATISYFVLHGLVGPTIEALYPKPVFYIAGSSLIFGNFAYIYYYMIGCAKRHNWELMKYVFLSPLYWIGGSLAAIVALYQLIVKPHYWEKTNHGLHLRPNLPKPSWAEQPAFRIIQSQSRS